MIKSTGHADLPLHTGTVPRWLADRMMTLGTLIVESLVQNYGRTEVLVRLSDPLWFQSFGAVMGMDWHSSGITTSVLYALKRGLNPRADELGIYVCGGRGKYSRRTPEELLQISEAAGLNGEELVRSSKLCAKVDNTAVQDGFQLYQHTFIITKDGEWAVVQQGMNVSEKKARRYHWCSPFVRSFVDEPHSAVVGDNRGTILNLTAHEAESARHGILALMKETPERLIKDIASIAGSDCSPTTFGYGGSSKNAAHKPAARQELLFPEYGASEPLPQKDLCAPLGSEIIYSGRNLTMPAHHDVRAKDVDLKRLGAVLATAYTEQAQDFESLLLTPGLGPRTLQSLALVSEVIHGTSSRFSDPARFSFAHGGKDGHPFPVPLKIYDESIRVLHDSIEKSKLGYSEKSECLERLHRTALTIERNCSPSADFDAVIARERSSSRQWGGRTVKGDV